MLRNVYRILVGKPEEKFGKLRHRWESNIKMNMKQFIRMWTGFKRFSAGSIVTGGHGDEIR
jgi:hypothetical protein